MLNNKEKNFVSAVIYLYNSNDESEKFLFRLDEILDKNFEHYELIFVNDESASEEKVMVKKLAEKSRSAISLINLSYHQGLEISMNAGIDLSIGDFVFEFDTTMIDYNMDLIIDAYKKSLEGFDIVSVSPMKNRSGGSSFFYNLYNKISGTHNKLRTESFRLVSRRGINRIKSLNKSIPYRKPIYANCGLPSYCIEYSPILSLKRNSVENFHMRQNVAINSLILFTDIAYRISFWLAIVMMLVAAGSAFYAFSTYLGKQKPVAGWTTTILLLAICFFAIFALLAIIIKYLSIILDMVFRKQSYIINSIDKFGR